MPAGREWMPTEGGSDYRCPETPWKYKQDPERYEQEQPRQAPERLEACAKCRGDSSGSPDCV